MLETIISVAQDTFSDENLKADSRLEEAQGFDSMAMIQFVMELETALDLEISDEKILKTLTCTDIEGILKEEIQAVS